eukprot:264921_1
MSHPTIPQNGAQKKRSMDHQTTAKAPYSAMQKKRKHQQKEKQPQKGGRAIKRREKTIKNHITKLRKAMKFNGQWAWIHHHTQRDAKSQEFITPSHEKLAT